MRMPLATITRIDYTLRQSSPVHREALDVRGISLAGYCDARYTGDTGQVAQATRWRSFAHDEKV
jgi:hypothetical protein